MLHHHLQKWLLKQMQKRDKLKRNVCIDLSILLTVSQMDLPFSVWGYLPSSQSCSLRHFLQFCGTTWLLFSSVLGIKVNNQPRRYTMCKYVLASFKCCPYMSDYFTMFLLSDCFLFFAFDFFFSFLCCLKISFGETVSTWKRKKCRRNYWKLLENFQPKCYYH